MSAAAVCSASESSWPGTIPDGYEVRTMALDPTLSTRMLTLQREQEACRGELAEQVEALGGQSGNLCINHSTLTVRYLAPVKVEKEE